MNIDCLRELLGDEDANALVAAANKLPSGAVELLKLIAASIITSNEESDEGSEIVNDQWITGVVHGASSSLTIPDGAKSAIITPYNNDIYFVLDGGNAHGGQAHYLQQKATLEVKNLEGFKIAAIDSSSAASVYVTYYK